MVKFIGPKIIKAKKMFMFSLFLMLILLNIKITLIDSSSNNKGISFLGMEVNLFDVTYGYEDNSGTPFAQECVTPDDNIGSEVICKPNGPYCRPRGCM
ncbi:MAG: hypothetical protein WAV89_06670 [Ignavibacteriaceae bacterium]